MGVSISSYIISSYECRRGKSRCFLLSFEKFIECITSITAESAANVHEISGALVKILELAGSFCAQ